VSAHAIEIAVSEVRRTREVYRMHVEPPFVMLAV
jgi:hypothetical protein